MNLQCSYVETKIENNQKKLVSFCEEEAVIMSRGRSLCRKHYLKVIRVVK